MKRFFLFLALAICVLMISAQIPAKVNEIMQNVDRVMGHSENGSTIKMTMNVSMLVSMGSVKITSYDKGDKSYSVVDGSILGKKINQVTGDDGIQHWEYDSLTDSLIISKSKEVKEKGEYDLDLDMSEDYRKASLKEKKDYYEITFTEPIDKKDTPSKTELKIRKNDYMFMEMTAKMGAIKITMKLDDIKMSVSDDQVFVFDKSKFPTAKIEYK